MVNTMKKPSLANFWEMAPPTPQRTATGNSLSSSALPWAKWVLRPPDCHLDVAPTTTATGFRFEFMSDSFRGDVDCPPSLKLEPAAGDHSVHEASHPWEESPADSRPSLSGQLGRARDGGPNGTELRTFRWEVRI